MTDITKGTKGKSIQGFPNYEITRDGRIWNKKLEIYMKPFENILKHRPNNQPYLRISLSNGKTRKKFMVHRLVAMAHIPNPENKPFVNHKNGNKQDNRVGNLEWISNRENCIHASKNGLIKKKITDKQVREIRDGFEDWTQKAVANHFGVSRRLIGMIRKGERRTIA